MKTTNLAKAAAPIFAELLASGRRSVSLANTAKLVRAALRDAFPAVKFSVRSSSYAGGASISVSWTDGPTVPEVDKIAGAYDSASFDGMIDLKHSHTCWLSPEGVATLAHDGGTVGSMGSAPEMIGDPHHPNALEVSFGADYVNTSRTISPERKREILAEALATYAELETLSPAPTYVERTRGEYTWTELERDPWLERAGCWLSCFLGRLAYNRNFEAAASAA